MELPALLNKDKEQERQQSLAEQRQATETLRATEQRLANLMGLVL